MKLTKEFLREHKIYNPYNLTSFVGNKIYIGYSPSENGRLTAHYAHWIVCRIDFIRPENKTKEGRKEFTVYGRDTKQETLKNAITWVKQVYNIEISEKDAFGAWHQTGTLKKLKEKLKA